MKINYDDFIFSGRGSTALWAILESLNLKGAKVLLPVNVCEIVYPIILKSGMVPVFYDVDERNGNASLETIEAAFTGSEAILLAVHNFGAPLEIDRICDWASRNNVFVIEDVCNSLGACYHGTPLGSWGDAAIFSFGYAKIIEYGLGGGILVRNSALRKSVYDAVQSLDLYSGIHKAKDLEYQGILRFMRSSGAAAEPAVYCSLYDAYSDYLLYRIDAEDERKIRAMLETLALNLNDRARKAFRYRSEIITEKVAHVDQVPGQIYWRYNLLVNVPHRQNLIDRLRESKLLFSMWYPPIAGYFSCINTSISYPGSQSFSERVLNLFVDHRVSQDDLTRTIEIVNSL